MKKILFVVVIALALSLRFFHYLDRTSYGWDQIRDLQVLNTSISTNQLPLLGPIVRGDLGGFYLGPLYHYLLLPIYQATNSNPLALVWVSIVLDVSVVVILYLWVSPSSAIIWSVSTMLINSSLTPWNVSLINLWVLVVLLYRKNLLLYYLLLACSTSIHLTLLPIAGVLILLSLPDLLRSRPKITSIIGLFFALLLPQIPLIISDIQTNGSNLRAAKDFFFTRSTSSINVATFAQVFVSKLDATVSRLFLGTPFVGWGIIIFSLLIILAIYRLRASTIVRNLLVVILILFSSLWVYHDPDFAEYYFNAMLIPLVAIAGIVLDKFPKLVMVLAILLLVFSNLFHLSFTPNPYGLGVKKELISRVLPHVNNKTNLILSIPEHEHFGFAYFLAQHDISISSDSTHTVVIAPANSEHVPAPPTTPSVIYQSSLAAYRLVVFSN